MIVLKEEASLKIPVENTKGKNKVQRNLVRINGPREEFIGRKKTNPGSFKTEKKRARQKPRQEEAEIQ